MNATGHVFGFGDAPHLGSAVRHQLESSPAFGGSASHNSVVGDSPVVAITADSSGSGYWLVTANSQVLAFGNAPFMESARELASTVVGMIGGHRGHGYLLVEHRGEVLRFHAAAYG